MSILFRHGDHWVPPPARTSKKTKFQTILIKNPSSKGNRQADHPLNLEKDENAVKEILQMIDVSCQTLLPDPSFSESRAANCLKLEKFQNCLKLLSSHSHSFNAYLEYINRSRNISPIDEMNRDSFALQSDQCITSLLQTLEVFQFHVLEYEKSVNSDARTCSDYADLCEESKDLAIAELLKTYDILMSVVKLVCDSQQQSALTGLQEDENCFKQQVQSLKREVTVSDLHLEETEKKLAKKQAEVALILHQKQKLEEKNSQLLRELSHTNLVLEQMKLQTESHEHLLKNAEESDRLLQIIEDLHDRNEAEKNALKKAIKVQKQRADEYKIAFDDLTINLVEKEQAYFNLSADRDQWKVQLTAVNNDLAEVERKMAKFQWENEALQERLRQMGNSCGKKINSVDADISDKSTPLEVDKRENELACKMLREESKNLISLLQEVKGQFYKNSNALVRSIGNHSSNEHEKGNEALYELVKEVRDQLTETYKVCQQCTEGISSNRHVEVLEKEYLELKTKLQDEIEERQKLQKRCDELESAAANSRQNDQSLNSLGDQQDLISRLRNLEKELDAKNSRISTLEKTRFEVEQKHDVAIKELEEKLERATVNSESMRKYVELLKSSYLNVFGMS